VVVFYGLMWAAQLIPPHVDYFVWQRWALATALALSWWALLGATLALFLFGVLAFVLLFFVVMGADMIGIDDLRMGDMFGGVSLVDGRVSVAEWWLIAWWVLVTLWLIWLAADFAGKLWRADARWKVSYWLVPLLVISVVIGRALALGFAIPVTVDTTCDYTINVDHRLRFTFFRRERFDAPDFLFVEHRATGESWQQTVYTHDGVESYAVCRHINSLARDLVWFWTDYVVFVSHDGGESWHQYGVASDSAIYSAIRNVTFRDAQHGTMVVSEAAYETWREIAYITTDGGRTWVRVD
jgi:hypothetical protein